MPTVQTPSQRRANTQFQKNITRRVKTNSKERYVAKHPPTKIPRNIAMFFILLMSGGIILGILRFLLTFFS
ncbi:Protein tam14 [Schizosaccharomyces pombe]|uniref:Protein tam14 n=1 Tax=Schizosaccharomyces pombe (strain 972 / ATCC 24843) TaxID=284812 RepID=TAM14_SCHPO|nr:protein tam14 [Schizosaccharomyces pombe]G2TRT3.1 RecName: Full=Protein tam14; AltName: Full=Transcripts altered in meiosis protein 14 [Schizosaccharomyces pombe 972h-]CCD31387.1 conserved fungal protein [Schizosaccharomyces pombe]|eukprot:NP_001343177.1 protein tam14 [Schizosaccharomyces pombe]